MSGNIAAPADDQTFTILVGRTTFRIPRSARFTDSGGGNYAGYVMHYQTFAGRSMHDYLQEQLATRRRASDQHPELDFDDPHRRAAFTYDGGDGLRHLDLYQDLSDGGAIVFETDYGPGAKGSAIATLAAVGNDVLPVQRGAPIPLGMGMGNSVLTRSMVNDEVADPRLTIPLPGYKDNGWSGLQVQIVSQMTSGRSSDDTDAKCHNGQLGEYDAALAHPSTEPEPYTTELLRYREREVAGIPGGEIVEFKTEKNGSSREASFTYESDTQYPPPGQPQLLIRATAVGFDRHDDLRLTLATWDAILASAAVVPMPAPPRGILRSKPDDYTPLPPCHARADVVLSAVPSASPKQRPSLRSRP